MVKGELWPVPKKPYSFKRLSQIAMAAVVTFCACLAFWAFANRDNPSNVPTLEVQGLATAATGIAPSSTPLQGRSVNLTLSVGLVGDLLTIQGTTDLPNRTILMYKVTHVAPDPISTDGTIAVLDGQYTAQVDVSDWPSGTAEVWVGFQTLLGNGEMQPQEVIERYGERGEYLHGENVAENSGLKRVEVRQTIEVLP
jgi:hypothetical protein